MILEPESGSLREPATTIPLIERFLRQLHLSGVVYCHWKSNDALDRSASGENDLDLLVSRASVPGFAGVLSECGFKEARVEARWFVPGITDYYGFDADADRIVHVHAHYDLVLGDDYSKNYRLPVEEAYLASSRRQGWFYVPSPSFEYVVFVIRMALKHALWEAVLMRRGRLSEGELGELAYLQARMDPEEVDELLAAHLPTVTPRLVDDCVRALAPGTSVWERVLVGHRIAVSQKQNARLPRYVEVPKKVTRRFSVAFDRRVFGRGKRRTLVSGGSIIAIIGGDGAGKTTAVDALQGWLAPYFATARVHMGKPRPSLATAGVRGAVGAARALRTGFPATGPTVSSRRPGSEPTLHGRVRDVLIARDRYRAYVAARRKADSGTVVVTDRFPLPQIRLMDGKGRGLAYAGSGGRAARLLADLQNRYYQRICMPDLAVVLRVHPEIAVQRRVAEDPREDPELVRSRSTEIWEMDWTGMPVELVDAGRSKEEVIRTLKEKVWSRL